jgi:hypothetical protein
MTESLDESMTGMGDPADYDDWDREEPTPPDRLVELATQFAELAGLTVGPAAAPEPVASSAVVRIECGACRGVVAMQHFRLDPGVTNDVYDVHYCSQATVPGAFPFTLTVRSGA